MALSNLFMWVVSIYICKSMHTPPQSPTEFDGLDIIDFDEMIAFTKKFIDPHVFSPRTLPIMQNETYFTCKFHANVTEAQERIQNDASEAEGHNIIYIKDQSTWYQLKIPQNIIVFGGGFCPPHKGHFENVALIYPYYDHIIIAIQAVDSDEETRNGYNFTTIKNIWTIYMNALLPDQGRKIIFYKAMTGSGQQEPLMLGYKFAINTFHPGTSIIKFQIPDSRIDVLMGPDNKRYIKRHEWNKFFRGAQANVESFESRRFSDVAWKDA
eukprot:147289_1